MLLRRRNTPWLRRVRVLIACVAVAWGACFAVPATPVEDTAIYATAARAARPVRHPASVCSVSVSSAQRLAAGALQTAEPSWVQTARFFDPTPRYLRLCVLLL